ncbi:hypothetical protein [Pyrococcus kukulkanii]|uniref:hypothetical protein n=1 Tax=Pyrococcus kukulkanii TaxID=1609559 RepID=UPI003562F8B2
MILGSIGIVDIIKIKWTVRVVNFKSSRRLVESSYVDRVKEDLIMEVHRSEKIGRLSNIVKPIENSGFRTKMENESLYT